MVKGPPRKNLINKLVESRRTDERSNVLVPHGPHFIFSVTKKCLDPSDEASKLPSTVSNTSNILTPACVWVVTTY